MSIIENAKFELRQEVRKVLPQMDKITAYAYYNLTPDSKDTIMSLDRRNFEKFNSELAKQLRVEPEAIDTVNLFPEIDEISFMVPDPEMAPDSLEFYFYLRKNGEIYRQLARLILQGYRLEFGMELGTGEYGGYTVEDLKIEESVTEGGKCVMTKYEKNKLRGFLDFEDPVTRNICFNMLKARFGIYDFEHLPY